MAGDLGKISLPDDQPLEELLAKHTVPELQQELKRRGLKRSGVKAKLIQRLKEAIESEKADAENENDETEDNNESQALNDSHASDQGTVGVSDASSFHDPYTDFERSIPGVIDDVDQEVDAKTDVAKYQEDTDVHAEKVPEEGDDADISVTQRANFGGEEESQTQGAEEKSFNEMPVEDQPDSVPVHELSHEQGDTSNRAECEDQGDIYDESENVEECLGGDVENPTVPESQFSKEEEEEEEEDENEDLQVEIEESDKLEDSMTVEEAEEKIAEERMVLEDNSEMETGEEGSKENKETDAFEAEESHIMENKEDDENTRNEDAEETKEIDDNHKEDIQKGVAVELQEIKQPKKQITPVQLKKRKLVPAAEDGSSSKQETAVPRKRRWGSSANKESVIISTDSLKEIIPEVSIIPSVNDDPLGLGLDYGEMEEGEIDETVDHPSQPLEDDSNLKENEEPEELVEGNFKKEVRRGRIVRISTKDTIKLQTTVSKEETEIKEDMQPEQDVQVIIPDEKVSLLPGVSSEDPDFVREKSPSPAKNDPSRILSVRNLVRPFTLRQLREFLSKSGTVIEDGFWINHIKSHCYVTYATEEEAIASRSAIHGTRWPAANPKLLSADFALNDEMYRETGGKLGNAPSSKKIEERKPSIDASGEPSIDASGKRLSRELSRDEESISRKNERPRDKESRAAEDSAKPKEKKEAAGKLLDDLFRKTKATPCIYWLPLTKEQIAVKEKEREQRREERQKLNEEAEARGDREREERRQKRQMELGNDDRARERRDQRSPRRFQNKRFGGGPSAIGRQRSPRNDQRAGRQLPAQYHKAPAFSSPSSSDEDNRGKFSIR
eukprot:gene1414-15830_t